MPSSTLALSSSWCISSSRQSSSVSMIPLYPSRTSSVLSSWVAFGTAWPSFWAADRPRRRQKMPRRQIRAHREHHRTMSKVIVGISTKSRELFLLMRLSIDVIIQSDKFYKLTTFFLQYPIYLTCNQKLMWVIFDCKNNILDQIFL